MKSIGKARNFGSEDILEKEKNEAPLENERRKCIPGKLKDIGKEITGEGASS